MTDLDPNGRVRFLYDQPYGEPVQLVRDARVAVCTLRQDDGTWSYLRLERVTRSGPRKGQWRIRGEAGWHGGFAANLAAARRQAVTGWAERGWHRDGPWRLYDGKRRCGR